MKTQAVEWTPETLQALSRDEALALFSSLPPPTQMAGEFGGHIPAYIEPEWRAFLAKAKIGHWLGKGYINEPHSRWQGHGYNVYEDAGGIARHLRFGWSYAASSLDGKPALIMQYAAFDNWAGRKDLTDEIRQAAPGVMLGIYFTKDVIPGFSPRPGNGRTEPEIFILNGPIGRAQAADRN